MRKKKLEPIRDRFLQALTDIEQTFVATQGSTMADANTKLIAEYSMVSATVLWEGYISDLFLAYLNRDSSKFAKHLQRLISLDSKDEMAKRVIPYASVEIKPHFTIPELRQVLDEKDYNITFASTAKLKEAAGKYLATKDARLFTGLTAGQCSAIDMWRTVRNFLAHRSAAARREMQKALVDTSLPPAFKRGTNEVRDVGSFLISAPPSQQTVRLLLLLSEMKAIGSAICP